MVIPIATPTSREKKIARRSFNTSTASFENPNFVVVFELCSSLHQPRSPNPEQQVTDELFVATFTKLMVGDKCLARKDERVRVSDELMLVHCDSESPMAANALWGRDQSC
jgi:hypothetical protein